MSRHPAISIGDRFTRVGQPDKVFTIMAIRIKPGFPDHAELRSEGGGGTILIGVSALTDRSLYQRVSV